MTKFAVLVIGLTLFPLAVGAQEPGRRIGLADGLKARYAESRLNLIEQAERILRLNDLVPPSTERENARRRRPR